MRPFVIGSNCHQEWISALFQNLVKNNPDWETPESDLPQDGRSDCQLIDPLAFSMRVNVWICSQHISLFLRIKVVKQSSIQYSLQDCVFIKLKVRGSLSRGRLGLEYRRNHQHSDGEIPDPNIFTHVNHYRPTSNQSFNCARMLFASIVFFSPVFITVCFKEKLYILFK